MAAGNPAHHLHRILLRFEENSSSSTSIRACWEATLDEPADFSAAFSAAMALVPAVRRTVTSLGLDQQLTVVDRWEDSWLRPFAPIDRGWTQGSQQLVEFDSLLALVTLSDLFGALGGVPALVGPEESQTLLGLLDDARAAIRDANLPADLRSALLARLQDVQWAIEHYTIQGPEGLQAALERLGAVLARTSRQPGAWRRKAGVALVYGWLLFSNADEVVADLQASAGIVTEVVEWTQDAAELIAPVLPQIEPSSKSFTDDSGETATDPELHTDIVDAEIVDPRDSE